MLDTKYVLLLLLYGLLEDTVLWGDRLVFRVYLLFCSEGGGKRSVVRAENTVLW